MQDKHFLHLFWFCVGVFFVSFCAMIGLIYLPFPVEHRDMAANAQGFLQGSLIMSAVGFLLTGSINTSSKKPDQKITTEVTPTTTTVTTENPPLEDKK